MVFHDIPVNETMQLLRAVAASCADYAVDGIISEGAVEVIGTKRIASGKIAVAGFYAFIDNGLQAHLLYGCNGGIQSALRNGTGGRDECDAIACFQVLGRNDLIHTVPLFFAKKGMHCCTPFSGFS